MKSIRHFLLISLLLSIVLLTVIIICKFLVDSRRGLVQFYDVQLMEFSRVVPKDVLEKKIDDNPCEDTTRVNLALAIWKGDAKNPAYLSCRHLDIERPVASGFRTEAISGEDWRVYTRIEPDSVIAVAQPLRVQSKVLTLLTSGIATQITLLIPFFLLVLWFVVDRSLKPFKQFTNELRARSPTALHEVSAKNLPNELLPVANALNDLLGRLKQVIASQKNFITDAAHEILTPLTALQVQFQVLERAKTEERRLQAVHDVKASLERCVNLARQLLALARSSSDVSHTAFSTVNLVAAARAAVEEALPNAHEKNMDLGVLASAPALVLGDPFSLKVLLRNLIDNAIKYSSSGGRVDVLINSIPEPHLIVSDAGPGVAAEDQPRIFDRFYRGRNSDTEGNGLGLAIVKEIADRHHANIELKSPGSLGGLDVIVRFQNPA